MFRAGKLVKIKSAAEIMSYPEEENGWRVGNTYFNPNMLFYCGGYATISFWRGPDRYTLTNVIGTPESFCSIQGWDWDEEMLEPAFEVGTRVRIKDWENVRDIPLFVSSMRHLC